jgi:DNA-binding LytR/AlgR family response regulator
MRVLLVDDEPIARQILREELEAADDIEIAGEASDGEDAVAKILSLSPDVVFLDLQMPGMGGFDVIQSLEGHRLPFTVIVTAYEEHAIRAFEAGAIDYLLKPVGEERLRRSVDRIRRLSQDPTAVQRQEEQIKRVARDSSTDAGRIIGRLGNQIHLIDPASVLAFEADHELVWVITHDRRYLAANTLRSIEERLDPARFTRVHRGVVVNLDHIRKVSPLPSQRWLLTLSNGREFTVSKRQASAVRKRAGW